MCKNAFQTLKVIQAELNRVNEVKKDADDWKDYDKDLDRTFRAMMQKK